MQEVHDSPQGIAATVASDRPLRAWNMIGLAAAFG
jgi:hypothetical protein